MAATMTEVARRAKVGIGTVSRVVNNSGRVRPATRQRVLDAINDLGYRQTRIARALVHRGGHAPTAGVLSPFFTLASHQMLLRGCHSAAVASGYHLLLTSPPPGADLVTAVERAIRQFHVDGVLLVATLTPADTSIRQLIGELMPAVCVERQLAEINSVCVDEVRGGQLAAEHLWQRGCRRPAVVSLPKHPERRDAFVEFYRRQAPDQPPPRVVDISQFTVREGHDLTEQLLADQPDGFFFCSDLLAIGGLRKLRAAGLRLPVVGYDNLDFADPLELTTVDQQFETMGRIALEMLVQQIEGHRRFDPASAECRILQPRLIVRAT